MHEKLDYFDPLFIAAFIMAALSDFAFLFLVGLAIPVIGQVLAIGILGVHYVVGVFLFVAVLFKLKHLAPKLILGIGVFLPLPTLSLGLAIAIVAQNRLVELVLTQAALAATTAGAGNVAAGVAEGVSAAGRGVQAAGGALRGAEAAAEAAVGAGALVEGAGVAGGASQATRASRIRGGIEKKLRTREGELKKELGLEEKEEDSVSEEDFGIVESTDKMKELFEPAYNKEEVSEEEFTSPVDNPAQEIKSDGNQKQAEHPGPEVQIDENKNEVNLKEAA